MAGTRYNWKRFWRPREGRMNLSDDGFLVDPDEEWGSALNPDLVSFQAIAQIPCLILLGEPGIGKSTALVAERDRLQKRAARSGGETHWVDLRTYGTDHMLHRAVFESSALQSWRHGTHELDLFLDSLDECLLRVDSVSALLTSELEGLPVGRLFLRIACRTAEWPSGLESALRRLWGEDAVKAFELAPLRRVDVAEAARVTGVPPEAFLDELRVREAVPLAIKPVTLNFLLNSYRRGQAFPASRTELYTEGCRCLCEETSESRRDAGRLGALTAEQRLAVAARIAALTVFCKRYAIWTGADQGDIPDEDIRLEELLGGTAGSPASAITVSRDAVRETLDTGLFSSRGLQRSGWAHQTYAEFLAARFLVDHALPADRVMDLIRHPDGKIVPQLRETAAWLASMAPEVFRRITALEPEVLLRSDVATADVKDRAALVEHLLLLYDQGKLVDSDWDLRMRYRKLNHPGLAEQLRPYITDRQKAIVVRRVAIDIAEACEILSLQEDLVRVALDETDSHVARVQAAFAISQIGEDSTRQMLRPLAMGQAGDDPDDELRGCGLASTWPRFLAAAELLPALVPPKQPDLIGMYARFLDSDIAVGLQPSELLLALKWVEEHGVAHGRDAPLGELADAILARALDHLEIAEIPPLLGAAVWKWCRVHGGFGGGKRPSGFRAKLAAEVEKRRELAEAMLPLLCDSEDRFFLIYPCGLIDSSDVFWLIDRLKQAEEEPIQQLLAALIARVFDWRDVQHFEAVFSASQASTALAEELRELLQPVELGSPKAEGMRADYELSRQLEGRRTARPRLEPPPERRIADQLERSESGDLNAFLQLTMGLTLEPDGTCSGNRLDPDLTVRPGWKHCDTETKKRILAAARRFLEACDPEPEKWLGTDTITYATIAGYQGLMLLHREAPDVVFGLPEAVWDRWAPMILAYPLVGDWENDERHHQLTNLAYQRAPNAVLKTLLRLIDAENQRHGTLFVLRRMGRVWGSRLADALLEKVTDRDLKPGAFGELLRELLRHDVPGARAIAAAAIGSVPPADGEDRQRANAAAKALLTSTSDAGWEVVWPALQQDIKFGLEVLSSIAHECPDDGASVSQRLTDEQLADLFIWLARNVPFESGPVLPSSVEWWRSAVLDQLKGRGTTEACAGIRRAMTELPHLDWLQWHLLEAEQMARQRTWVPLQPTHLLEIVTNSQRRVVQTGDQLLEVLIESLKRLEVQFQGETPAAIDLWNEVHKGVFQPKDEPRLSDYIKRHLDRDIVGSRIVVNREVQTRHGAGSSPGERIDIHVDAVATGRGDGTHDRMSAIIEVKGCWHRELMDAMETQLAERYLKDNRCPFGLYVVGWFTCEQWDDGDARKRQTPKLTLPEAQACFDDQAQRLSTGGRLIKAFVLNSALR